MTCVAFTPWAVYAFDSVLVKAGRLRNSVTVTAEGAAGSVSIELEDDVEEADVAAAPVEAGEEEEKDVDSVVSLLLSCRRSNCPANASFANPRALL